MFCGEDQLDEAALADGVGDSEVKVVVSDGSDLLRVHLNCLVGDSVWKHLHKDHEFIALVEDVAI